MKRTMILIFLGAAALFTAACGSASAAAPEVEFTIEMTEFAYSPDTIEVSVGQTVTLNIVNEGALEHEVMFGRKLVSTENGVPVSYMHDLFGDVQPVVMTFEDHHGDAEHHHDEDDHEGSHTEAGDHHGDGQEGSGGHDHGHHGETHGFMISLPGGSETTTSMTFTVTEEMVGEWEIGCLLDGGSHYQAGMVGTLIVAP